MQIDNYRSIVSIVSIVSMMSIMSIKNEILEQIENSDAKIPSNDLEKELSHKLSVRRREVQSVLRELIEQGELTYTYQHGHTFVEKSFNRPIRIASSVVLKPPEIFFDPQPGDVVINIAGGASFGTGNHPSTRLAIQGIEQIFALEPSLKNGEASVLDVGTGTGILALLCLKLGMKYATGIDTDPCARHEAGINATLNKLQDRFEITDQTLESIRKNFNLITANLRTPTLLKYSGILKKLLNPNGVIVLSGIKTDELSDVVLAYTQNDAFDCVWGHHEKQWAGIVIKSKSIKI